MTQPTLPPDVFDAVPPAVQAYIRFLEARVGHLEVRLAHLEARLDSNSSKPPSNAAGRAVRHAVCWRETSFGTDRERGSRSVGRALTAVATCRQQGRGVLDFLVQALSATTKPSLLPKGA